MRFATIFITWIDRRSWLPTYGARIRARWLTHGTVQDYWAAQDYARTLTYDQPRVECEFTACSYSSPSATYSQSRY